MDWPNATYHQLFNFFEGWFWLAFAIIIPLLFRAHTTHKEKIALIFAFIGFGISDFIEIYTGAWYRPWWLFLLKAICLISIITLMYNIWHIVRQSQSPPSD